jgi:hypothetical protein
MRVQNTTGVNRQGFTPADVLASLHRGDGAVTFHQLSAGRANFDLGAVPVRELRDRWPTLAPHLQQDACFAINSMRQQRTTRISEATGLPIYTRGVENVESISALWVDCDADKVGLGFKSCLIRFLATIDLPRPRWMVSSGRGFWAVWEIEPCSGHNWGIQKRCLRALVERFAHLGADIKAAEPARIMRVPGSLNTKVPARVNWYDTDPAPPVLSLVEWANLLGIDSKPRSLPGERRKGSNRAMRQAAMKRWSNGIEGFRKLWKLRGHFDVGVRHDAIWLYSFLLHRHHEPAEEIERQCLNLAAACRPPLSEAETREYIALGKKTARQMKPFRNSTMAEMLQLTAAEREQLTTWFEPKRPSKRAAIEQRQDLIRAEVEGEQLSVRQLVERLRDKYGFKVGRATVERDLHALAGKWPIFSAVLALKATPGVGNGPPTKTAQKVGHHEIAEIEQSARRVCRQHFRRRR